MADITEPTHEDLEWAMSIVESGGTEAQARVEELSNETLFAGTLHRLRKRFKRTALGEAISGHQYEGRA